MLIGRLPDDYKPPRVLVEWRRRWAHLHITGRDTLHRKRFAVSAHLGFVWLGTSTTGQAVQVGPLIVRWCHLRGAYWHRRPWRRLHVQWQKRDEKIVTLLEIAPAGPTFLHGCRCRKHRADSDRLRRGGIAGALDEAWGAGDLRDRF